jgi:hypothetical protein
MKNIEIKINDRISKAFVTCVKSKIKIIITSSSFRPVLEVNYAYLQMYMII